MTRLVELRHRWRGLSSVAHPVVGEPLSIGDGDFLPVELKLAKAVTVVAGLNGAGKTRALQSIEASLGPRARFVSLHKLGAWIQDELSRRTDIPDLVEEAGEAAADHASVEAVRAIVGKSYRTVSWASIDVSESPFTSVLDDDVVPYIRVEDERGVYSSFEMGEGELTAHLLVWLLWYLRDQEGQVLLLDEPDALLPPAAREQLLDHIANYAVTRAAAVVATSHSNELIRAAVAQPGVLIYLGTEDGRPVFVHDPDELRELVETVLLPPAGLGRHDVAASTVRCVVWLEDDAAVALARELLRRVAPESLDSIALYWTRGEGDLRTIQLRLPRPDIPVAALEFAVVFDGDVADLPKEEAARWPALQLPGRTSPDVLFQQNVGAKELAYRAGKSKITMETLLASLGGRDPHDWTDGVIKSLQRSRRSGLAVIANALLDGPRGEELVDEFRVTLNTSGLRAWKDV